MQILEPSLDFKENWHHRLICHYLERVHRGEILRLLINVAPRSLKSIITSVCFPCWEWLYRPHYRYMCLSYSGVIASDHNQLRRDLIRSEWYQDISGGRCVLKDDKNRLTEFANVSRGLMKSVGLEGSVTGGGGDRLIFDDPNNPDKVESNLVRESTNRKFKDYSIGRRNDPKRTAVVVIQQRTHDEDVSGMILKKLDYVHLCIPTEAEDREEWILGDERIVRRPGDLLHPERFGKEELEEAKSTLGSYLFASRHQQRPVPREGGLVKLAWFERYAIAPHRFDRVVQSWDTASKSAQLNDPWCCTTWGEYRGKYYLLHTFRQRLEYPDGKRWVKSLAARFDPSTILIEDKGTGQSLLQELKRERDFRWSAIAINPCTDKETRMSVETGAIESGRVYLPENADWLAVYEEELGVFPLGSHDDQVDSTSQFLFYVRTHPLRLEGAFKVGGKRSSASALDGF